MESAASVVGQVRATQGALSVLAALQLTAPLFPPRAPLPENASYEYVVVGAGSAGATVAARLAELPGARVLLVEAGDDPPIESLLPGLLLYIPGSRQDWNYSSSGDERVMRCHEGGAMRLTRGRMLGGTSSANYMAHVRGSPRDYERWAVAAGDPAWGFERLLPYFMRSERLEDPELLASPAAALHGTAGCMRLTRQPSAAAARYLAAFRRAGHATPLDLAGREPLGYAQPLLALAGGVRQSTAYAFLSAPGRARCGAGGGGGDLHVLRGTLVTRILLDGETTAVGVEALAADGRTVAIGATREVIVSAGAINTPQLLMLSGIGPAEHLAELGIGVRADLPVGRGLQDHPAVLLSVTTRRGRREPPPPPPDPTRFPGDLFLGFAALDERQAHPDYETANFVMPANSSGLVQFCAVAFGLRGEVCDALGAEGGGREALLTVLSALRPRSRGAVRLRSADPRDPPDVRLGFYSQEADLEAAVDYIEHFLRVLETDEMREWGGAAARPELPRCGCSPGAGDPPRAYWRCYARCLSTTQYHYCGTCALGAVTDARLRVRGARRLRVADASVMPVVTSGNTNAPCIMIGERAADFIKEEYYQENSSDNDCQ